jgi:ketosteroid isomerase-like protein
MSSSTQEVADQLVALCRAGKMDEAIQMLYANDVVSMEAGAPPGQSRETKGLDAIKGKSKWWAENHQVHSIAVDGPIVAGVHFATTFKMDITQKASGHRFQMEEIAVYRVEGGKITYEEFFYKMG